MADEVYYNAPYPYGCCLMPPHQFADSELNSAFKLSKFWGPGSIGIYLLSAMNKMHCQIHEILNDFGIETKGIRRPADAMLAQVYFVNERYVLRSRPLESKTPARFVAERRLCDQVTTLTGFHFPKYEQSKSGNRFVIGGSSFWTLHKRIPGHPLGSWFELHRVDPSVTCQVLNALHELHKRTTGCFDEKLIKRTHLFKLLAPALAQAPDFLSVKTMKRLRSALSRVKRFCELYQSNESGFVHGDFHHGNILAHNGRIIGFIDIDWCHVGSYYEDLAFTLMMLLRDYESWSCAFRLPLFHNLLDCYGFEGDLSLLFDFMILYALFDCSVFKSARFDNVVAFFEYQKKFIEAMCHCPACGL